MENPNRRLNFFAYGTLMDSGFVGKLCGRPVEMVDARLEGYAKEKPEGGSYYIAAKHDGSAIEGKLLLDLTSDELKMLDFWEGYGISKDELLGHRAAALGRRDEILGLVKQDKLEGFSRIARYQKVLEHVVTADSGTRMEAPVYVR